MSIHSVRFGLMELSDDPKRIDFPRVHGWLASTYWCPDIPPERLKRGIDHSSLVAGAYHEEHGQCAFARVVTDFTRFAHLMDVFVAPDHRAKGLGKAIVRFLLEHPRMDDIDTWSLGTNDAHGLYESFGFVCDPNPEHRMVLRADR